MPADVLDLLRAADPASLQGEDRVIRERVRAAALATPVRSSRRRLTNRGRLVLVAATLAAALVALGGWTLYSSLVTGPESALDEFHAAQGKLTLPPGETWTEPSYPADALYGRYMGLITALDQATCAWFSEWGAAASAGDRDRVATAEAAVARIRGLMPGHEQGAPEEGGGYDAASLAHFDGLVRRGQAGHLGGVRQYVKANC
jgi:hypothetical protein